MEITAEIIRTLREKTGAGMMDCKRALVQTSGDMNAAIEFLRKKGAAVGQKRADRATKEGVIVTRVGANGKSAVVVEINCETDFVGRSEDFIAFANAVAEVVVVSRPANAEAIMELSTADGKKIADLYNSLLAKVGEKIELRRFEIFESPDGVVSSYTHLGNKIGVLVELMGTTPETATSLGRDVAMQIAAMNPAVITRDQVDKTAIEKELDIFKTQAKNEGKPDQIIEKIAVGRLEKYFAEICLMEQTFIKDSGKTIKDVVADAASKGSQPVTIRKFRRYLLGEEMM